MASITAQTLKGIGAVKFADGNYIIRRDGQIVALVSGCNVGKEVRKHIGVPSDSLNLTITETPHDAVYTYVMDGTMTTTYKYPSEYEYMIEYTLDNGYDYHPVPTVGPLSV